MFESSQYLTSESFGGLNKTLDERHAAVSMARVWDRSLVGIAGSNLKGGKNACFFAL